MKKIKTVPLYVVAYVAWILFILIFLWFILYSRVTWISLLGQWAGTHPQKIRFARFVNQFYVVFIGMSWLALMIIIEAYFRNGVAKGILLSRIGKALAPEVLAIAGLDIINILLIGFTNSSISQWGILLLELLLGIGFVWVGKKFSKKPLVREKI